MKRLVLRLFDIITWPFAKCGWPAFCQRCSVLWRNLYSAYIRHLFRQCGELKLGSTQLHLFGLRYMEFGDQVEMHFNARVQCIDYFQPTDQHFKPRLILHDHVVVQAMCHIGYIDRVEIGEWSTMGARCYITDHTHGGTSREELLLPPTQKAVGEPGTGQNRQRCTPGRRGVRHARCDDWRLQRDRSRRCCHTRHPAIQHSRGKSGQGHQTNHPIARL